MTSPESGSAFRPALVTIALSLIASSMVGQEESALTLERAVELALSRNERVAAQAERVEASEARLRRARTFFFPDFNITGNYTRRQNETIRRIGDEDVTVQTRNALAGTGILSATLFNARAFPLYRQARFELEGVKLTAQDQKRRVAFEAANAFVVTLSNEQVLRAAVRRRDFARTTLNDARARFEAGLVSSNDVTKVELEIASAERELARTEGDASTARLELSNLLHTEVTGPLQVPTTMLAKARESEDISDGMLDTAVRERDDLNASRQLIRALREFASEPSRRIIPSLGATGQFRATNEGGISGNTNEPTFGLNLNWALFDGGEASADRAERRALLRIAQYELELAERDTRLEVRSAGVALDSDRRAGDLAIRASELAKKNADETSELYRQGLATALEVADANVRYFEAEVEEARRLYELLLSYFDLRLARGLEPL